MIQSLTFSRNFFWLGLWLLAASWLFGLEYFSKASPAMWGALVALGTLLICFSQAMDEVSRSDAPPARSLLSPVVIIIILLLPAVIVLPWPYRIAPVLMVSGALLELLWRSSRWLRFASAGVSGAGTILLAQSLALVTYKHITARSHELPWPIPQLLAGIARLVGVNCAADGSDLVLPTMRLNHRLGATWELFLEPATLCFVAGGLMALAFACYSSRREEAQTGLARTEQGDQSLLTSAATRKTSPSKGRSSKQAPRRNQLPAAVKAASLLLVATLLWLPSVRRCTSAHFYTAPSGPIMKLR